MPTTIITATTRICVTERPDDFHSCIEGYPSHWESGLTIREAVRKIRVSYPELAKAEIIFVPAPNSRV